MTPKAIEFTFTPPPVKLTITAKLLRETLIKVQDALLRHDINGGGRNLNMNRVCSRTACGTAACIGGWVSIFLLGIEAKNYEERKAVDSLFGALNQFDNSRRRLHQLFFSFGYTENYNEPNVAATAIQRYLDGVRPWPNGRMPNVLRYKRAKKAK